MGCKGDEEEYLLLCRLGLQAFSRRAGVVVKAKPSAESKQEVHVHGKNPKINVIQYEQDPGSRRDGRQVLERHFLRLLPEDACSRRGSRAGQRRSPAPK